MYKGRYEFDVYCKLALTNIKIKPHSGMPSSTTISILKGLLTRATKIYINEGGKEYLTDMFYENRYQ